MHKKNIEELFEGYVQDNLSSAEQRQLMELIEKGKHDVFLQDKILGLLKSASVTTKMDRKQSDEILNYILSNSLDEEKVYSLRQSRKKKLLFQSLLVAASLVLLISLGSLFFNNEPKNLKVTPVTPEVVAQSTLVNFSGKQLINLPDGSTVLLNDGSSLKYDQNTFNAKTREVSLTGEAFFDIEHNKSKPFIVHTGKIQTKVLGTAFNIKAQNISDDIEVTVARGKVQVGEQGKIFGVITPNQQIKVNKITSEFEQNKIEAKIVTEWKNNYLIFDDISMNNAMTLLMTKYKTKITTSNEKIKNCKITASFLNNEDLEYVLKVICSVIDAKYYYNENGTIIIEGKGCEN